MSDILISITFYHGTDIDSALDILNNGLQVKKLEALQKITQIGPGWYTTLDVEVAWFFASLAPGNIGRGYTVIEIELTSKDLEYLVESGLAKQSKLQNVPFSAAQYLFKKEAFEFLNTKAVFRPYLRRE